MAEAKRQSPSRTPILIAIAIAVALLLGWAFWPRPVGVDFGQVTRGPMVVTIDEEARTRVRDAYVVSAPVAARLMRVEVEPGDAVTGGETVIARLLPAPPSAIDVRTREQALAGVRAAEAALRVARADLNSALAGRALAESELDRERRLVASGTASQAALDRVERAMRAAEAAVDTATAAISMREAEIANARAQLIEFSDAPAVSGPAGGEDMGGGRVIPLTAPVSGQILRVMQESETTVSAGQAILEIGDVTADLEVVVELLSTDAVQVSPADRVLIDNWGGEAMLEGVVEQVEPWGFTKFSALGVEEQRVNTIVRFTGSHADRRSLGHGYRVEARIVTWSDDEALQVPSSALFRHQGDWAVFRVEDGVARLQTVTVINNNGFQAAIADGPAEGGMVILYPGPGIADGQRVTAR